MKATENKQRESKFVTLREYNIGRTRYIVRATVRDGATEDATAKVRRLIRNEVGKQIINI